MQSQPCANTKASHTYSVLQRQPLSQTIAFWRDRVCDKLRTFLNGSMQRLFGEDALQSRETAFVFAYALGHVRACACTSPPSFGEAFDEEALWHRLYVFVALFGDSSSSLRVVVADSDDIRPATSVRTCQNQIDVVDLLDLNSFCINIPHKRRQVQPLRMPSSRARQSCFYHLVAFAKHTHVQALVV